MDGLMDGRTIENTDGRTDGEQDRGGGAWMVGRMDGFMAKWKDTDLN